MGFRSTFVTDHSCVEWPEWFVRQYEPSIHIGIGILSSKSEMKAYGSFWGGLPEDIQKCLLEDDSERQGRVVISWLHECGGISRTEITRDSIRHTIPTEWEEKDHHFTGHSDNCYGCSDYANVIAPPPPEPIVKEVRALDGQA